MFNSLIPSMIISYIFLILSSNTAGLRRDKSILYSRFVTIIFFLLPLIELPFNILLATIYVKVENVIIDIMTNSLFYKNIKNIYEKKGIFFLVIEVITVIHYKTIDHLKHNMHNMIGFQCFCI